VSGTSGDSEEKIAADASASRMPDAVGKEISTGRREQGGNYPQALGQQVKPR
jgi:hypothetical protein